MEQMKETLSLDQVKTIAANILRDVDKLCRENNLTYFVFYGTLLGTVRHKGFIPWDDDIDIIMPRADYNKIIALFKKNIGRLRLICPENDRATIYPHGKIVDTGTDLYIKGFRHVPGYGIGIDVFPIDYMSNDEQINKRRIKRAFLMRRLIGHSAATSIGKASSVTQFLKKSFAFIVSRFINTYSMICQLNSYNRDNGVSNYMGVAWDIPLPVEKLFPPKRLEFEGFTVCGPSDPDYFLTLIFGNYMQLPPIEEQVPKHHYDAFLKNSSAYLGNK